MTTTNIKELLGQALLIFIIMFSSSYAAYAQKVVGGTVKDEGGEVLIGVSVFSEKNGKVVGTVTDVDGNIG